MYMRLIVAGRVVTQIANRELQNTYDIDHFMFFLMLLLHEAGGVMEQRVLVERALSNKQSVTAGLNRLERKGMIQRRPSVVDGRNRSVVATATGTSIFNEIRWSESRKGFIRAIESDIETKDGKRLAHLLGELIRNAAELYVGTDYPWLENIAGMEERRPSS